MTTSGTVSQTVFRTNDVVDTAFVRCKLPKQLITAENIQDAKNELYLLLSAMANNGIQLWCVEKKILPLYQGQAEISLPAGTVDVLEYNYRTLSRLSGTNTSSAGGTVANAVDDDFATSCTQTSTNGNIKTQFASATLVSTVGILPNATGTLTLVAERSDDAVTWTTVKSVAAATYTAGVWEWIDIDGAIASAYWRVRETGGGTIDWRELFWGNTPSEIPLARLNQDDYWALPNKAFAGQALQFWFDRQRDTPIMHVWPVTDLGHRYDQFVVSRKRYIQDVGTLTETLDVPQRWFDYTVWDLAHRVAIFHPSVDEARETKLMLMRDEAYLRAIGEERDDSPMTLTPDIGGYTA